MSGPRKAKAEPPAIRCAIYTRKSSEEGLEQEFNSLDAQREAAEAFIASQKAEGWQALPDRYDDGGFTGGNMDRPGASRLLADIEAGKVDCVVVYKVDRLSRSLMDFARIMEVFERHNVSFVSVTQQFNTTHSMGRLTLNILLSFAQFEREIIGERIRDKLAAQRRKGKWTGGIPILGYDVDRSNGSPKLAINAEEAARVREIFQLYLRLGSLLPVVQELDKRGWDNKVWRTRAGQQRGGRPFDKCSLYNLLTNPLYAGKIKYKDEIHEGEHESIVPSQQFGKVQALLQHNGRNGGVEVRNRHGALLRGLLCCKACGQAMTHTFTAKGSKPGQIEVELEGRRKLFNNPSAAAMALIGGSRKASMEATLGIEFVRRLIDDLTHVRNDERRNRTDITDEDIRLKENELSILRHKRDKLEARRKEAQEDISTFSKELEERKKRFSSLFGFDPDSLEEARTKERRRVQLSTRLSEVEHNIRTWAEATLPLALLGKHFPDLRGQIDAEARTRKQAAVRDVADELAQAVMREVQAFEAEDRKNPLSEAEGRVLRDRIVSVVRDFGPGKEIRKVIQDLLQLSDTDMAKVLVRLEEVESNWSGEFERLLAERQELKLQHDDLQKELRRTSVGDGDRDAFGQLQSEIESYAAQVGRKREELRQVEEDLVSVVDSITSRERELDMLYQKHAGSQEQAAFLKTVEQAIELLSEYMERLRETKIGQLKASTTEMYKQLASKGDLISDIDIDPKSYLITIRDRSGHVVQKQNLSAGEKEVFAISLLWGLAQTSQLRLPIVIDTPLSRLDSTHRDRIVSNYFPSAAHQVVVLSTDTEVDQNYYRELEPHLQHAVHLLFDKNRELTTLQEGYFWRNA